MLLVAKARVSERATDFPNVFPFWESHGKCTQTKKTKKKGAKHNSLDLPFALSLSLFLANLDGAMDVVLGELGELRNEACARVLEQQMLAALSPLTSTTSRDKTRAAASVFSRILVYCVPVLMHARGTASSPLLGHEFFSLRLVKKQAAQNADAAGTTSSSSSTTTTTFSSSSSFSFVVRGCSLLLAPCFAPCSLLLAPCSLLLAHGIGVVCMAFNHNACQPTHFSFLVCVGTAVGSRKLAYGALSNAFEPPRLLWFVIHWL